MKQLLVEVVPTPTIVEETDLLNSNPSYWPGATLISLIM
jgi:hypothetical protein